MLSMRATALARPSQAVAAVAAYATGAGPSAKLKGLTLGREVVFVDGVRTPFLTSGSDFMDLTSYDLGRMAISGLINKTNFDGKNVDACFIGTVLHNPQTSNVARECALGAGIPATTPCNTTSLACISANLATIHGTNMIATGNADAIIVGGTETLSDMVLNINRPLRKMLMFGKMYKGIDGKIRMLKQLMKTPPGLDVPRVGEFSTGEVMGHSADRLAIAFGVSRAEQDAFAIRSHTNSQTAQDAGYFSDVLSVFVPGKNKVVSKDNGIRITPAEKVAKLKPAFIKEFGNITAANSSFFTDGASAALIMAKEKATDFGYTPKAYLRHSVLVGRDPRDQLLLGPAYAVAKLLKITGLTLKDFDVIEFHEAFAGQVLANLAAMDSDLYCQTHMGHSAKVGRPDESKTNCWGGSLSLGHPFGATGVRLLTAAANRLHHEDGQLALVTACAAGGHAVASIVERY